MEEIPRLFYCTNNTFSQVQKKEKKKESEQEQKKKKKGVVADCLVVQPQAGLQEQLAESDSLLYITVALAENQSAHRVHHGRLNYTTSTNHTCTHTGV